MTYQLQHCKRLRSQAGSTAEFGPAMFILFVMIVFPMIGLLFFITGVATVYFATTTASNQAAAATSRYLARDKMNTVRKKIMEGPFGKFGNAVPFGGGTTPGMTFKVVRIKIDDGSLDELQDLATTGWGSQPPDTTTYLYLYKVISKYRIKIPFLPEFVFGQETPFRMDFAATAHVEHPEGISIVTP